MGQRRRPRREGQPRAPSLWQTWLSVMAALFGVQSRAKQERDFTYGKASHFILLGLLATLLLVLLIIAGVALMIRYAGH